MNDNAAWIDRKKKRLRFLAELFREKGFTQIGDEVDSMCTETEIRAFYGVLKNWLF